MLTQQKVQVSGLMFGHFGLNKTFFAKNLNSLLKRFYAEVKTKNGEDYEPDSLRVMIAAIDRFLKDKGYKLSFFFRTCKALYLRSQTFQSTAQSCQISMFNCHTSQTTRCYCLKLIVISVPMLFMAAHFTIARLSSTSSPLQNNKESDDTSSKAIQTETQHSVC